MNRDIDDRENKAILLSVLRDLAKIGGDFEQAHAEADKALLNFIGDAEVTKAFDEVGKWYA